MHVQWVLRILKYLLCGDEIKYSENSAAKSEVDFEPNRAEEIVFGKFHPKLYLKKRTMLCLFSIYGPKTRKIDVLPCASVNCMFIGSVF